MLRLLRRAAVLFGLYALLLLAVVFAGFLGGAVGIWASILWGAVLLVAVALYVRNRQLRRTAGG